MFNRNKFKATAIAQGITMQEVAEVLGVSPSTLTRKMNGESDFTRNEIQLYRQKFHLTSEECDAIFFEPELA